jgi:hypothetical protein
MQNPEFVFKDNAEQSPEPKSFHFPSRPGEARVVIPYFQLNMGGHGKVG